MSDETTTAASEPDLPAVTQLDWRTLVPTPEVHACTCEHCELVGELEPIDWPTLATFSYDDEQYVTDRVLALHVSRAPVPDDWEGPRLEAATPSGLSNWSWHIDDVPPTGVRFRGDILAAFRLLRWRLRRPVVPASATGAYSQLLAGVVDEHGQHIGWIMGRKTGGELYVEPGGGRPWRETQESCPRCGVESGRSHALGAEEGGCDYDGPAGATEAADER
ncbi:hypothetical protein [Nocardioides marmoraquaticus]